MRHTPRVGSILLAVTIVGCGGLLGLKDGTPASFCTADAECPTGERCILAQDNGTLDYICYPTVHCSHDGDCLAIGPLGCAPDGTCRTTCGDNGPKSPTSATCKSDQTCTNALGPCANPPCPGVSYCYGKNEPSGCDGGCSSGDGGNVDGGKVDGGNDGGGNPVAQLPIGPRAALAAVVASNGLVYVFGGVAPGVLTTNATIAYDPVQNTWTNKPPMPHGRAFHGAALAKDGSNNDVIVVVGGYDNGGMAIAAVDVYDVQHDTWKTGMPMPTPRGEIAVASGVPGRVFVAGGRTSRTGGPVTTVEAYDALHDVWETTVQSLPTATVAAAAASTLMTQRTYVLGGDSGLPVGPNGKQAIGRDGNGGGAWMIIPSLLQSRIGPGAAMSGQTIVVAGGVNNGSVTAATERFVEGATGWMMSSPMHVPRAGLAMAAYGQSPNAFYIAIGGFDQNMAPLATVEIYSLQSDSWR